MNNELQNFELLDILNILSFVIGLKNYNESLTQGDKQELINDLNRNTEILLRAIQKHLIEIDGKLDKILEKLEEVK